MSPLDDELRAALHRRATAVSPSPDPLAGIERRATRMQRNRVAASVAGSVLAVAAIATGVPLLAGTTSPRPDAPPLASTQPSPAPSGGGTTSPYVLDPDAPWAYRGTPLAQLGEGTVDTIARELAVRSGVAASAVALTPLWGQVHEPSAQPELVYVATVDGEDRWGVARAGEAGPELLVDEVLPSPALALAAALPGDEVARLLVVTAPDAGEVQYGHDDSSEFADTTAVADGVAVTPLDGDPATDLYRVLDPAGTELHRAPAPDAAAPGEVPVDEAPDPDAPQQSPTPPAPVEEVPGDVVPGDDVPAPTNVVDWPLRGSVPPDVAEEALTAFATAAGVSRDEVGSRLLFGTERDGTTYVLLQGWYGGDARAFAWARRADGGTASVLMDFTAPGPAAFGAVLDGVLVVVPEPRAGQVLYSPDGVSEPAPVPDQGTEAAVLIDRAPNAAGDRLLVLDGDGDPDRPILRGTVEDLLAASS